jgi:hypothetical protein
VGTGPADHALAHRRHHPPRAPLAQAPPAGLPSGPRRAESTSVSASSPSTAAASAG